MHFHCVCGLLVAAASFTAASPFNHAETSVTADATLRLIKVSESDPGTWVREDEKIEDYVAKGINFVDITDMSVSDPSCRHSHGPSFGILQRLTSRMYMCRILKWHRHLHDPLRLRPRRSLIPQR